MKRSRHSLSHYRLLSAKMGQLIPVGLTEVIPGDTFRQQTSALIRAATLTAPVMHPITAKIHHFFVPNRIIWDGWEKFITGQDTVTPVPQIDVSGSVKGDIVDHLGLPATSFTVNALPIRAYNKIYNEFFRDQDIDAERSEDDITMPLVRWQKDYFTTARPTPQKGDAVTIPIDMEGVPIRGLGTAPSSTWPLTNHSVRETGNTTQSTFARAMESDSAGRQLFTEEDPNNPGYPNIRVGPDASANIDINELRQAFAYQRFLEHRNRFGSRHVDYLRSLGIRPSDGRLDRPEYLGGGKQTLAFSEVLVHAEGTNSVPGDMAGHGIAAMRTRRYRRFFEEAGHVISLMSVRPKPIYADRIARNWLRTTKDDYWQKEYEQMGPQPVFTAELYGLASSDTTVFGYNGRHDEYRREPSFISGDFKNTFKNWHFARKFSQEPVLNSSFLECAPSTDPWALTDGDNLLMMVSHRIQARRLVAKVSRH